MLRFLAVKRGSLKVLFLAGLLALAPALAQARMGGGGSFGSRGMRTWSAPPSTRTMPGTASPFERSMTPRPGPGMNGGYAGQAGYGGSSFGRGLMGGLAGGLLGAGLFGLMTGQGFFGGMGGFMSIIGLLMQAALIFFLARLAFNWFTNRQTSGASFPNAFARGGNFGASSVPPSGIGGFGGWNGAQQQSRAVPIKISPDDFNCFERLLGELQSAYSAENLGMLRLKTTPEMASYFDDELEANQRRGVVNRISDVKLLQGDLSEAWREGNDEYATVAMRFSLNDVIENRTTGRILDESPGKIEAVEAWTFTREAGSGANGWKLSAIQQQGRRAA